MPKSAACVSVLEFFVSAKFASSWHGDESFRSDPKVVEVFLKILADFGKLRPVLFDMHQSGLLGPSCLSLAA